MATQDRVPNKEKEAEWRRAAKPWVRKLVQVGFVLMLTTSAIAADSIWQHDFDNRVLLDTAEASLNKLGLTANGNGTDIRDLKAMFAPGGFDVFRNYDPATGQYLESQRYEVVWENGKFAGFKPAELDGKPVPAIGSGRYLVENPNGTADQRFTWFAETEGRTESVGDYSLTEKYLTQSGKHPFSAEKDARFAGHVDGLLNGRVGKDDAMHNVYNKLTAPYNEAARTEIVAKGGYIDEQGRAWKPWIDPKYGPSLVLDADGDSTLPRVTRDPKDGHMIWYSSDGKLLNPKA